MGSSRYLKNELLRTRVDPAFPDVHHRGIEVEIPDNLTPSQRRSILELLGIDLEYTPQSESPTWSEFLEWHKSQTDSSDSSESEDDETEHSN